MSKDGARGLLGEDRLRSVLREALRDGVPAVATVKAYDLDACRFAESRVHQPQILRNHTVTVRAFLGRRMGSATVNDLSVDGVRRARTRALENASAMPEVPAGYPLPGEEGPEDGAEGEDRRLAAVAFDPETATLDATAKAPFLGAAFAEAESAGVRLAGNFRTAAVERAVADSAGLSRYFRSTHADLAVWGLKNDGPVDASGFAGGSSGRASHLRLDTLAAEAISRCLLSHGAEPVDPGSFDVVLTPRALGQLFDWMAMIGFSSRSVADGSGFLADRAGELVTGDAITVHEAPRYRHPAAQPLPFDDDGVTCRRVTLIHEGRAGVPVHSRWSAAEAGCASSGNSLLGGLSPDPGGQPRRLVLEPGRHEIEDLIDGVERGLFVTRFHYVNGMLDPRRALMTGLTRDGTFLIENGRLVRGVRNLRWSESILLALARVDALGADLEAVPGWWLDARVHLLPAVRIRGFTFTGRQELAAIDA